jgi:hypothetical protein
MAGRLLFEEARTVSLCGFLLCALAPSLRLCVKKAEHCSEPRMERRNESPIVILLLVNKKSPEQINAQG